MHDSVLRSQRGILTILLVAVVSLSMLVTIHGWVRTVPFDAETVYRFILPFRFDPESRQLDRVLAESLEWNITRQFYSLSFLVDYTIWGTDAEGYHISDILLTALCAVIAWRLFASRMGMATAWIALLLWLAHAAQGWSIFIFTGRNDRVMLLFFLAAMWFLDRGMSGGGKRTLAASAVCFALGAFAKEAILSLVPVLFLWSALGAGEGVRRAFLRRKAYWMALVCICAAYLLTRNLLGAGNPDGVELASPSVWLTGTGALYNMLVPWGRFLDPDLSAVAGLVIMGTAPFLRFLPDATRFGAAAVLLSLLPIPLFWVQTSFAWIPALWMALAVSALIAALHRRLKLTGWRLLPLPLVLTVLLALWGNSAGRKRAEHYMLLASAAELVEPEDGHYTVVPALSELTGFRDLLERQEGEAVLKTHAFISALVSLRFDTEQVVLTGTGGVILECAPRWR